MRTRVFITIDTEFSIAGAFGDPSRKRPVGLQNVMCEVAGRSEGLGFMLDTFAAHGIRATFFIEALQAAYFGDAPMREVAQRIATAGHDAQLHLHPVWTYFDHPDWQQQLAVLQPSDNMHRRSVESLAEWMRRGIESFARWGLPAPVALRTGNLMVDRNVYLAMRQVGLRVASNVGRAVFEPEEPALRFDFGAHTIEGIVELPVLSYAGLKLGRRVEHKAWTITGSSVGEAVCLLERAHAAGHSAVVLLTHCHEFVKGEMGATLLPNRVNQRRLVGLCRFLRDAGDRFEVTCMDRMLGRSGDDSSELPAPLAVPARLALARMLQNKLSDHNLI